ncbi:MAG: hypothetical protein RR523_16030 [Cetobacterium sp.]|uniref:crAss001_48 related protein n=1 Tax=unclassified Cetobacterium TaxID=2630983 RepID=UPI000646B39B|nr:hypothetical protein [Cetobacterium sp. ZOR0034]
MNSLKEMKSELKQLSNRIKKYLQFLDKKDDELDTMEKINIDNQLRFMFQYKWELEHRIRLKNKSLK